MINLNEVFETNKMIHEMNLDVRTITIGISSVSYTHLPADLVLIAAGFLGSEAYVTEAFGVKVNQRTNVETKPDSFATNVENVFTAGEMCIRDRLQPQECI